MHKEFNHRPFLVGTATPATIDRANRAAQEAFDRTASALKLDDALAFPTGDPLRLRDGRAVFALAPGLGRTEPFNRAYSAAGQAAIAVLEAAGAPWMATNSLSMCNLGAPGPGVWTALIEIYGRFEDARVEGLTGHQRAAIASGEVLLVRSLPPPGAPIQFSALMLLGRTRADVVDIVEPIAAAYPGIAEVMLIGDDFASTERLMHADLPF